MNNFLKNSAENHWSRKAVIYQIYPRSFKDTNNDGVGDLQGIIEKLDYLNDGTEESLGIGAIWISPVYKSPMADFGYDVSDYYDIDPLFGDLKIFDKLVSEAHVRGIKVIMDFIPNHSSSFHPWFLESRSSRRNSKRDWYIWRDPKPDGSPPNNWLSVFGGSAWTHDEKTNQYYLHTFLSEQPDLNWRNKKVIREMQNVLKFWMNRGVDGFRIDVLDVLIKDDKFRDDLPNPEYRPGKDDPYDALLHVYSRGRPELIGAIDDYFCSILGAKRERFMIGEVDLPIDELLKFHQACTDKLHVPFNFNLLKLPWTAGSYRRFVSAYDRMLGPGNWPNYVLGNHDLQRFASRRGKAQARIAAMMLLTFRGIPFIYYGEELGMEDVFVKDTQDPRANADMSRDPERTPMQWTGEAYAGFSRVKPWLPVSKKYKEVNVERESNDPQSILNLYRKLIHYRSGSSAILLGRYRSLDAGADDIFAFLREHKNEKVLILLNFSGKPQKASLKFKRAEIIMNTHLDREQGRAVDLKQFLLRPNEGYILKILP